MTILISSASDSFDILSMILPLRPGTDFFSKNLLRDESIKYIIITIITSNGIIGDAYSVGDNELHDGKRADMIYFPLKEFARNNLVPIIVEVQKKVDHTFVARSIWYCLDIFDDIKVLPVLVVISINGFSSKEFHSLAFDKSNGNPFYTHPCQSWAKRFHIYTVDSIRIRIDSSPIDLMIALAYIIIRQEKNIVVLVDFNDPIIKGIYKTYEKDYSEKSRKDFVDTRKMESISLDCSNVNFFTQNHLGSRQSEQQLPRYPSGNLTFVTNERTQLARRFNWNPFYVKGRDTGMLNRFSSHVTLKQTFSRDTL